MKYHRSSYYTSTLNQVLHYLNEHVIYLLLALLYFLWENCSWNEVEISLLKNLRKYKTVLAMCCCYLSSYNRLNYFFLFEKGFRYAIQAAHELTLKLRLPRNHSRFSCLSFPSAGIKRVHHHTWRVFCIFKK